MTYKPVASDLCADCGTSVEPHAGDLRCPACFERHLYEIDAGFLESYRKFGCRARLVVAETCLRGLVVASPDHRKVLAMTVLEQYVQAMNDLAGLFSAFIRRNEQPIIQSFMEYRLDTQSATAFFETVRSMSDVELCTALGLPLPQEVAWSYPSMEQRDKRQLSIAVYQLVQELRKATEQGDIAALALAQMAGTTGAVLASDAKWLNGAASGLTPDQVAMVVMDKQRRTLYVQGLTADENAMGRVVDATDTVTRAASNLIYAYLQAHDL